MGCSVSQETEIFASLVTNNNNPSETHDNNNSEAHWIKTQQYATENWNKIDILANASGNNRYNSCILSELLKSSIKTVAEASATAEDTEKNNNNNNGTNNKEVKLATDVWLFVLDKLLDSQRAIVKEKKRSCRRQHLSSVQNRDSFRAGFALGSQVSRRRS